MNTSWVGDMLVPSLTTVQVSNLSYALRKQTLQVYHLLCRWFLSD